MNRVAVLGVCACVAMGLMGMSRAAVAAPDEPSLKYRGAGSSRVALDAMQLQPFDQSLWGKLSGWSGTAPKAEDMTGKVVLVVTWANWYKVSHGAMRTAQALSEQYKDKGLVVVGVNNKTKPEGAAEKAKELGITFPIAEDKDNAFHTGIKADQDPNVYFIDRAGNMRYAQVDTSSMETAAAHLIGETAEQAADYPKSLERKRVADDAAKWKTREAGGIRPGSEPPTVSFPEPEEEAYAKVKWPYRVGKVETDSILNTTKNDPPKLAFPEEDWEPKAPKRTGKLVLVYYVDPQEPDMLGVIPSMNRLYDKYHRDVVVVCSLFKIGAGGIGNTGNQNNGGGGEGEDKIKTRNKAAIPALLRNRNLNHYVNPTVMKAEGLDQQGETNFSWNGKMEDFGIAAIISTDNKFRWLGNSHDGNIGVALDKIIAVDPGVQARRKAEAAQGKK